jgi:DNA-directed RNA polymerase subunit beta'
MSVYVPLSVKAQEEARQLMLSTRNVLSPANGKPIAVPSQDMVLGLYYITKGRQNVKGQGLTFANIAEVVAAYQRNMVNIHALIRLRTPNGEIVETNVGRVFVYEALPAGAPFDWVNRALKKRDIGNLVAQVYRVYGQEETVKCLDKLKQIGFKNATTSGLSLSIDNLLIPEERPAIVKRAFKEVEKTEKLYADGAITNGERYNKVIQTWFRASGDVASKMIGALEAQDLNEYQNGESHEDSRFNPVFHALIRYS